MDLIEKSWKIVLIIGLLGYIILLNLNKYNLIGIDQPDRIDSILKVITIAKKEGSFNSTSPQPIINIIPSGNNNSNARLSNELLTRFKNLEDDNAKTREYARAIALKVYNNVYKDSLVTIVVNDSIEGGDLKKQDISWVVKKQKVTTHDKIITKYPNYSISGGVTVNNVIESDNVLRLQLYPTIGYRNKKGWEIKAGINILGKNEYLLELNKSIFTKYNKDKIDF